MTAVKKLLTSADTLSHYNPSVPISLSCAVGIGVVIFHTFPDSTEKPIAYASRKLTAAEHNYAQIQKETLGIVFGVLKFRQYLLGQKFQLITDTHAFGDNFPSKQRHSRDNIQPFTKMHGPSYFLLMTMTSNIDFQHSMEMLTVSLDCRYKKNHQTWMIAVKWYVHWSKNSFSHFQ